MTLRFAGFQRHREAAAYAEAEEGETDAYLHLLLSAPAAGRQAGKQVFKDGLYLRVTILSECDPSLWNVAIVGACRCC